MEFYNNPEKVDEYERMCMEYDGSKLYEILEKHLSDNSDLLELGSGPGNDIKYLKNKFSVTGSDLSDEFIKRLKERYTDIPILKLDAVLINTNQKFDCIFSNKVLHHLTLSDLEKSFARQKEVIRRGGLFAHTFWLGDKEFTMEGMLFVFHKRENLIKLVEKYYSIKELYDYKEFDEGDSIFIIAENSKI